MGRYSPGAAPGHWVFAAVLLWSVLTVRATAGPAVSLAATLSPPLALQSQTQTAAPPPTTGQDYAGEDTCLGCHTDKAEGYHSSPHGIAANPRTPRAKLGCESCHGPGAAHVEAGGDPTKIMRFAATPPREASATCLTCHARGGHAAWEGSPHDVRQLSCMTCHSIHSPKSPDAQLTAADQTALCAECHRDKVAKLDRSGHMPLREGKMECSSCHNPHGSANNVRMLRAGTSISESCASCHTDKRGPFLYEHAPVRENCATCHDPHGSMNERMLIAKQPILCQRCHIHTRHPSTIYDALVVNTSNRLYARSCATCHSNVHGSNHPSGATFLR
jgi:DmsE family decaheme c-type cytochrome